MHLKHPVAFLDRDGTIIVDKHYLSDPGHVELENGAADGMRALAAAGYALVVVSNQSGIGRGLLTREQVEAVNARCDYLLRQQGVVVEGWYLCPHAPEQDCGCRKPAVGLALEAGRDLELDLGRAIVIGDKRSDVELGLALGVTGILVATGHGMRDLEWARAAGIPNFADLGQAAAWVVAQDRARGGVPAAGAPK